MSQKKITGRSVPFSTPWFKVLARTVEGEDRDKPYYALDLPDYIAILALTVDRRIILVRQFRPAIERYSLELPAGLVDPGEDPAQTARRELFEETRYRANELIHLGTLASDTGRLSNRLWCYFAKDVIFDETAAGEDGIDVVLKSPTELLSAVFSGDFDHALHFPALFLAQNKGLLSL